MMMIHNGGEFSCQDLGRQDSVGFSLSCFCFVPFCFFAIGLFLVARLERFESFDTSTH